MDGPQPYLTIRARSGQPAPVPSAVGDGQVSSATHDISRTSFHVKHIVHFARRVEESVTRAFPNRGRVSQRYKNVQVLLCHWASDDLFVLPELEDLEHCLRGEYSFDTDIFSIPSENSHLELMMKVGQLIKEYESPDTLFLLYYGGHARIDESRQSTWCATREPDSPWLQWSAIQTLLERSKSDTLILLDCCAGAASATFPTGNSITETISASSWDSIAPDPGRFSFTNALIEVLQEWRHRAFSAAMLHAEVLARLKHPRPVPINGKLFEARSTPVHFMMTANHKAPSIEICRLSAATQIPSLPNEGGRSGDAGQLHTHAPLSTPLSDPADQYQETGLEGLASNEPNEDRPHVMISLALEDDQSLDINAWEQWLSAFPAMAKYVKVQGVFKSHSTLLLVSMPVTVWDLLPEDEATSFIAFIRSNNLVATAGRGEASAASVSVPLRREEVVASDWGSLASMGGTTMAPTVNATVASDLPESQVSFLASPRSDTQGVGSSTPNTLLPQSLSLRTTIRPLPSGSSLALTPTYPGSMSGGMGGFSRRMILNQQQSTQRTTYGGEPPKPKKFAPHVERRLEDYYSKAPFPNDGHRAHIASNLGIDSWDVEAWFYHRREKDVFNNRFASMKLQDLPYQEGGCPRMILPASLERLLEISQPQQTLIFDLRAVPDYERSHIQGAINLRAPISFLQVASLDMIERAVPGEESHRAFSDWRKARCLVFYSRGLDHLGECPAAELLWDKLRQASWDGECFVLKGHYREFSATYDKFIVGGTGTPQAERARALAAVSSSAPDNQELYRTWLSQVESEDRPEGVSSSPTPSWKRSKEWDEHERELEAEFQSRCAKLNIKANELRPTTAAVDMDEEAYARKAQMVAHLDAGLLKLRQTQQSPSPSYYEAGHSKLAGEEYHASFRVSEQEDADEYVKISQNEDVGALGGHGGPSPVRQTGESTSRGGIFKVFRRP